MQGRWIDRTQDGQKPGSSGCKTDALALTCGLSLGHQDVRISVDALDRLQPDDRDRWLGVLRHIMSRSDDCDCGGGNAP